MSRKAKYDALLIAVVQLHEALGACYAPVELPTPVLSGYSKVWAALQGLGALKTPGLWVEERQRQRRIGHEEARKELDSQTHDSEGSA